MKKIALVILIFLLSFAMFGCDLFDESDSEFLKRTEIIDPIIDEPDDPEPSGSDDAVPTEGYELDGIYTCPEFSFTIPNEWRGAVDTEVQTLTVGGYQVTRRLFYYVQLDGVKAEVLRLDTVPVKIVRNAAYKGKTVIAKSSDEGYSFVIMSQSGGLPEDFTDYEIYTSIYKYLSGGSFKITPLI